MAEQTFRSPNFFENEIDLSGKQEAPLGVPAGVIGTSDRGPAFVPVTVGSYDDFKFRFGGLNTKKFGPYAVREFLKHRTAVTFIRMLGAGANATSGDITKTTLTGQVKSAGFVVTGSKFSSIDNRHVGAVQYIVGKHSLAQQEAFGFPVFTDNNSYTGNTVDLIRGMVMLAKDTRMMVLSATGSGVGAFAGIGPTDSTQVSNNKFKLVLSSSTATFGSSDGNPGIKIYTASLDPADTDYFGRILNTDPEKFSDFKHVLYAEFPVDSVIASGTVAGVVSGSANTSLTSGDVTMPFRDAFGHFDARYSTAKSPVFISQPFGSTEYDLFYFEARDDGEVGNTLYKISISNLRVSTNPADPYGVFSVLIRDWNDDDNTPKVLERFSNVSLNPNSDNYIAKVIGDRKVSYNFDATDLGERRLIIQGKYPNKSSRVRVVVTDAVDRQIIPATSLPFGFHGPELPKFNAALKNSIPASGVSRLAGSLFPEDLHLTGALLPPLPYRFKVTKGSVAQSGFIGNPGNSEVVNPSFTWGVKFERISDALNANVSSLKNPLIGSFAKFLGIRALDTLATGSGADVMNNNKFSLAKVALSNGSVSDLTSSVNAHMREAAYIRNAIVDPTTYTVRDGVIPNGRITLATMLANSDTSIFNRFSNFTKFTTFMGGGFDGVNILDLNAHRLNDQSSAFDTGGADPVFVSPGLAQNQGGAGQSNNTVYSYMHAITLMTDPLVAIPNILSIPGIREPFITDYAAKRTHDNGMMIYLMDIVKYDDSLTRLFDSSVTRPSVSKTISNLQSRTIDNNYVATYFPDVFIDDPENERKVKAPATIAALGALAFNDRVSYPWYAPAGFNRAALDFVNNVETRLNVSDRDALYDARVNPIVSFPGQGFVIFGQKTMQQLHSALDRVNVRRMLLEVKRLVVQAALAIVFEANNADTQARFKKAVSSQLAIIKSQSGIEGFDVIMDSSNNSQADVDANKLNGQIRLVPTRTIEYIAIDFIIANSGVTFV